MIVSGPSGRLKQVRRSDLANAEALVGLTSTTSRCPPGGPMTHVLAVVVLAVPLADRHGDPLPQGAVTRFGTVRFRVGSKDVRHSLALSPDGKYLAVEDRDGIRLWDTDTGRVAKHLPWRTWQGTNPKFALA